MRKGRAALSAGSAFLHPARPFFGQTAGSVRDLAALGGEPTPRVMRGRAVWCDAAWRGSRDAPLNDRGGTPGSIALGGYGAPSPLGQRFVCAGLYACPPMQSGAARGL